MRVYGVAMSCQHRRRVKVDVQGEQFNALVPVTMRVHEGDQVAIERVDTGSVGGAGWVVADVDREP